MGDFTRRRDRKVQPWSWDSLRYGGSGWWLDAALPRSPVGLLIVAFAIPLAWVGLAAAIADDRSALWSTHDIIGQLWFFPLHVICVRALGRLWADRLGPACDGLALDERARRRIRLGALGTWASIGAIVAAAYFVQRDISFGLTPDPTSGLNPFDDPDMWDFGALGRGVHVMMLALWSLEWLLFGYLLWVQVWILTVWMRELARTDFRPHLDKVLIGDGYSDAFELFSKTATISLVFALANLGFIAYTGELIPREVVEINGVGDFLREMSDLLSTALLFVLSLAAVIVFVKVLRSRLTRAVAEELAETGDAALEEIGSAEAAGDAPVDVARLQSQVRTHGRLLRASVFQREVDGIGGRTMAAMMAKASVPLLTTALKLRKLFGL